MLLPLLPGAVAAAAESAASSLATPTRQTEEPGEVSGIRIVALALLAAGTLLTVDDADAQARQPPPQWRDPAGPPVDMDVWLRRLVGRYSFEGIAHVPSLGDCGDPFAMVREPCQAIRGMGDCVSVGTGPGVQCVFNIQWHDLPRLVSYLDPAMALFGLDPGNAAINHLLVNNKGLPEGGLGSNRSSRATFRTRCVNERGIVGGCERIFRIEAGDGSRLVYIWIDVESGPRKDLVSTIVMSLRRVAQDEPGDSPLLQYTPDVTAR